MRGVPAFLLATLVVLGVACSPPSQKADNGGGDESSPAPSLVLDKVDGSGTLSLAEQKGKVLLVDLWATWCAPCIAELPHLQALAEKYDPEDFLMLGIVLESGSPEEIQEFLDEHDVGYVQLLGQDGTKVSFGPFLGYPTKFLIDREGNVIKRYFGVVGDKLAGDVDSLVRTGALSEEPAE